MNLPRGAFRVWVVVSLIWAVFVGAVTFNEFKNAPASPDLSTAKPVSAPRVIGRFDPSTAKPVPRSENAGDSVPTSELTPVGENDSVLTSDLTPVDFDPFAASAPAAQFKGRLIPVDYDPFAATPRASAPAAQFKGRLIPVDYDPFAATPRASSDPQYRIDYIPPYMKVLLEAVGIAAALPVALLVAWVTLAWVVRGFRSDRP